MGTKTQRKEILYPDMSGNTAWILGAGATLLDVWDWYVPDRCVVFTINSSVLWGWKHYNADGKPDQVTMNGEDLHSIEDYRKRVDYWFARDSVIFTGNREPERTYRNVALRHPTAVKIIQDKNVVSPVYPNVYYMSCIADWQRCLDIDLPHNERLMGGNTTLLAVLHYVYRCGFKRVVLSGVDFCRIDKARRWMDTRGITNSKMPAGGMVRDTAGERVHQCGMMRAHMNASNEMVRHLQLKGIEIFKTSARGMLAVPYIADNASLKCISENYLINYKDV